MLDARREGQLKKSSNDASYFLTRSEHAAFDRHAVSHGAAGLSVERTTTYAFSIAVFLEAEAEK